MFDTDLNFYILTVFSLAQCLSLFNRRTSNTGGQKILSIFLHFSEVEKNSIPPSLEQRPL